MSHESGIIRFGVFEVRLATGELRKNGARVKLQEQPFQVLAALLEQPGKVVTKEELKERLWTGDTFVDFDHSLSTAVNKIREALGDSASSPRFIETVPRRGYRFVVGAETAADLPHATDQRRPHMMFAAVVVLAVAVGFLGVYFWKSDSQPTQPLHIVPLTAYPGDERDPSFSPDGNQVVFSWDGENQDNYDIYALAVGSTRPLRLTTDPASDFKPVWSPDGRQIAFVRALRDRQIIFLIPPLGGAERKVFEFAHLDPSSLSWAPDGKSLVFAEFASPDTPQSISQLFWETGEKRVLTTPPQDMTYGDKYPAISPDGGSLGFVRAGAGAWRIYVQPIHGGRPRTLTRGGLSHGLSWTPDGQEIVYWWAPSYMYPVSLRRVPVSGGEPSEVMNPGQGGAGRNTGDAEVFHAPAISAQSERLVYERVSFDVNIWRYSLAGEAGDRAPPQRVVASTQVDGDARISPDGKRIAFDSTRTGSVEIWVCDADGSNQRPLTSFSRSGATGSPRWSPDGRSVVFDANRGDSWDVFIVDAEGGPPRPLVTHEAQDTRPSWSRDGRWVYFGPNRSGVSQIWKVSATGGDAVQISHKSGLQPFESPDGRFVYYQNPGAGGGICRIPADGGEEVEVLPRLQGGVLSRWDITDEGIYFVERREELSDKWFLRLLRFGQPEAEDVMGLPTPASGSPLDIAPNGEWFLYVQADAFNSDLMLVENFQ